MGKKVIRLTEADIEKIVRQVIQEQSDTMPLPQNDTQQSSEIIINRPDGLGGKFKIQGPKLFWCIDGECHQIWEKGSNTEWSFENGRLKPGGWVDVQLSLGLSLDNSLTVGQYNKYLFNTNYAPAQRNWEGYNVIDWQQMGGSARKVYYWALDITTGMPMLNVTVPLSVPKEKIKDTSYLNAARAGDSLLKLSKDKIIWGKTAVRYNRNFYFVCANSLGTQMSLGPETPTTTTKPKFKEIPFSLTDSFIFDKIDFVDEIKTNGEINNFIQSILSTNAESPEFKQHVINSKPVVYGYASRDDDPTATITGGFIPCQKQPTRGDYNLCLSEARAKKVADTINAGLKETGMDVFTYKGMGETDKFAPGMKWPEVKDNSKTAPNRRIETKIPTFTYQVN